MSRKVFQRFSKRGGKKTPSAIQVLWHVKSMCCMYIANQVWVCMKKKTEQPEIYDIVDAFMLLIQMATIFITIISLAIKRTVYSFLCLAFFFWHWG